MKTIIAALILTAATPFCAAQSPASTALLKAGLPGDVTAFLARKAECEHWAGEDAYDAERGVHIEQAVIAADCARIEVDEQALARRYRHSPSITKALSNGVPE